MNVLSIDLPWSADAVWGFAAWSRPTGSVQVHWESGAANPLTAERLFRERQEAWGRFDVVLVDHPIGETNGTGYRRVETAFTNSTFVGAAPVGSGKKPTRIQCPVFQPGAVYCLRGLATARTARELLGTTASVVVESFPQLSIPSMIRHAETVGLARDQITSLAAHKKDTSARSQLLRIFTDWTGVDLSTSSTLQSADASDAVLALLPAIQLFSPRKLAETSLPRATWRKPVWLVADSQAPHPSELDDARRPDARGHWLGTLVADVGDPGVRTNGILSMHLPGWCTAKVAPRRL